MNRYRHLFVGMLSGALAGIAVSLILWGAWSLPVLGLLVTRVDIINGMAAMMVIGTVGGGLYSLIMGRKQRSCTTTAVAGVILGLSLWIIGALVAVSSILGIPIQLANPAEHLVQLIAFVLFGIFTPCSFSLVIRHRWLPRV